MHKDVVGNYSKEQDKVLFLRKIFCRNKTFLLRRFAISKKYVEENFPKEKEDKT